MLEIYIEGDVDSKGFLACPLKSAIAVFLTNFCKTHKHRLNVVSTGLISQEKCIVLNPEAAIEAEVRHHGKAESIPHAVQQCEMPCIVSHDGQLIHSGLCSVLRKIVKYGMEDDSDNDLVKLLGHKEICLKACAEVSVWTKFCEIDLPNTVEEILSEGSGESSVPKDGTRPFLPNDLIKLENHLGEPPIVSNINKRRHELSKAQKNKTSVDHQLSDGLKNALSLEDRGGETLMEFEHSFAEGLDFTLTDLVLFPCISYLLSHWKCHYSSLRCLIPRVIQWYHRVASKPKVHQAVKECGLPQVSGIDAPKCQDGNNEELSLMPTDGNLSELNVREPVKKKFKAKQHDIDSGLSKIRNAKIECTSKLHPCAVDGQLQLLWEQLPSAAHPIEGELPLSRVERKCQQLENLVSAIRTIARPGNTIVDFCSGGVILVENKEESIQRAVVRVEKLKLSNVLLYQTNLGYYKGTFDIGTCLHACGSATDLVLQQCLHSRAAFVVCPCCYGSIHDTHTLSYPRSAAFRHADVSYQEYRSLCHSADQPNNLMNEKSMGKECMVVIDTDRAKAAEEEGYDVILCTLEPPTCSPKNNMLIGTINPR